MKDFRQMKKRSEKITALTAYDYPTGRLLDESGVDIILVGDSVGMVVLGYQDTTDVTLEEMLHHTRAVARGVKQALLVADMPIHTYDTPDQAVKTAEKFVDAGAQARLAGWIAVRQRQTDRSRRLRRRLLYPPISPTRGGAARPRRRRSGRPHARRTARRSRRRPRLPPRRRLQGRQS